MSMKKLVEDSILIILNKEYRYNIYLLVWVLAQSFRRNSNSVIFTKSPQVNVKNVIFLYIILIQISWIWIVNFGVMILERVSPMYWANHLFIEVLYVSNSMSIFCNIHVDDVTLYLSMFVCPSYFLTYQISFICLIWSMSIYYINIL